MNFSQQIQFIRQHKISNKIELYIYSWTSTVFEETIWEAALAIFKRKYNEFWGWLLFFRIPIETYLLKAYKHYFMKDAITAQYFYC